MLDASEQTNLLHSFAAKPWYAFGQSKSHESLSSSQSIYGASYSWSYTSAPLLNSRVHPLSNVLPHLCRFRIFKTTRYL